MALIPSSRRCNVISGLVSHLDISPILVVPCALAGDKAQQVRRKYAEYTEIPLAIAAIRREWLMQGLWQHIRLAV